MKPSSMMPSAEGLENKGRKQKLRAIFSHATRFEALELSYINKNNKNIQQMLKACSKFKAK